MAAATNGESNTKKVDGQTETIKVDDITPGKQEAQVNTITTTMTKAETAPTIDNVEKNDTNLTTTEKQVVNQKLIVTKSQEQHKQQTHEWKIPNRRHILRRPEEVKKELASTLGSSMPTNTVNYFLREDRQKLLKWMILHRGSKKRKYIQQLQP